MHVSSVAISEELNNRQLEQQYMLTGLLFEREKKPGVMRIRSMILLKKILHGKIAMEYPGVCLTNGSFPSRKRLIKDKSILEYLQKFHSTGSV